jgi:GntR family transcriptional regulator
MTDILRSLLSDWKLRQRGSMSRVPLYHRLYSVLKAAILDGTIAFGARMPTELQLSTTFGVSRITAKRAMDELAAENLIARQRGKGSHVTYRYRPEREQSPLVTLLENVFDSSRGSTVRVISIEKVVPPADIRAALELGSGETVHKAVRLRCNERGEPYAYYVSYTAGVRTGYTKRNLEQSLRVEVLRDNGIDLSHGEQTLAAVNAPLQIAERLGVEPGAALLSITRHSSDASGKVIDVLDCLYNPKRFVCKTVVNLQT